MEPASGGLAAVRVILFDAVGTLIRPEPGVAAAYHRHGRDFGSRLSAAEIADGYAAAWAGAQSSEKPSERADRHVSSETHERRFWQEVVARTFSDLPDTAPLFAALWSHFAAPCHWALFDDVAACWRSLAAAGYELGIASNFDGRLREVCAGLAPLDACPRVFASSELGWRKPAAGFFRAVERRLGRQPHELLLVGDSLEHDVQGASAAGWQALRIDRGAAPSDTACLRSLGELAARLGL